MLPSHPPRLRRRRNNPRHSPRDQHPVTPLEVRELLFRDRTERDKQTQVGPSEIGGCRRAVWHRLAGTQTTNPGTLRMASSLGTAFHNWIESRLAGNDRFLLETRVEREGIRGHIDCFDLETNMVIDWKTLKKSGVPYFPSKQQRFQVQVYGWLMSSLRPVDSVCLVGFPKDGSDKDIITHVEPYSEEIALEALAWLDEVKALTAAPRPEKPKQLCRDYCKFYDPTGVIGCPAI